VAGKDKRRDKLKGMVVETRMGTGTWWQEHISYYVSDELRVI
jgi:hypothetical protein